jgi:hypothetical protein
MIQIVSRIYSTLTIVSLLLLVVTIGFGLWIGDYNARYQQLLAADRALRSEDVSITPEQLETLHAELTSTYAALEIPRRRATWHIMIAVLASLVTVLVNSISVTYFIGTSRWCREVVEAYDLDPEMIAESNRLKRKSFPWALMGILVILLVVSLGAAADPGTLRATTNRWVVPHLCAALAGVAFVGLSYMVQVVNIHSNMRIVEQILGEVREIRRQRGLDVER